MSRLFAIAVVVLIAHAGHAVEPVPLQACAWVRAENDGAGSGFIVDTKKKLLVTCRHVVADRKKVDVYFPWVRAGELITDKRDYLRNRDELRQAGLLVTGTVLKSRDESDLALLELESLPATAQAVTFADTQPQRGDSLRVVGNRLDLDTLWNTTTGCVRVAGTLADGYFWRGKKLAVNAKAIVAQFATEEGDSGGPVFDDRGVCVGMDCALRRSCPLAAILIDASEVRRFIGVPDAPAKKSVANPIAEQLTSATVWLKPTATEVHIAGALIEKALVLTCARGFVVGDRVGVALPLRDGEQWVSERAAYRDPLALLLRKAWTAGTVIACDSTRDFALVKLDTACEHMKSLTLANAIPNAGDALHAMSHPGRLEFAWVYANGAVRQRGKVALDVGEKAKRVSALVCQLPAQAGSPGGPIVNAKGELVGVLSTREGAQQVGYCATTDEIREFLDVSLTDRPARTLTGLQVRVQSIPRTQFALVARALAKRADEHRVAGRILQAKRDCDIALSLDSACAEARLCLARLLPPEDALKELDTALGKGTFDRELLVLRATLAGTAKDHRKARGDWDRILSVNPADTEAREGLAQAHFALGDDAKAVTALGDSVRANPKRIAAVVKIILAHAELLEQKFPAMPAIVFAWFDKCLAAVQHATRDEPTRTAIADALKTASAAKTDADRVRILREAILKLMK
jgi:S1-C subfamily serine protease